MTPNRRPEWVTIDHGGHCMFWVTEHRALAWVREMGGWIEAIPNEVDEYISEFEDEDADR